MSNTKVYSVWLAAWELTDNFHGLFSTKEKAIKKAKQIAKKYNCDQLKETYWADSEPDPMYEVMVIQLSIK